VKREKGERVHVAKENPPMILEAKIQGDCTAAIAREDVYHTNKLCQFCLIDPRTKTKFPGEVSRRHLLFDPGITTVSSQ